MAAFLDGGSAWDAGALEWLLELGNSGITYRSRYLASPQLVPVLDLLLLHEQNPHSLRFPADHQETPAVVAGHVVEGETGQRGQGHH
ncbi:alpha-E domain-containing protein [Pseudomonas aeruginosa]